MTLAAWWTDCGSPGDALVLPGGTRDGHVCGSSLPRHVLYPAMKRAGIDRVGPTGEKRNFHSLRHTFAKVALESGAGIFWPLLDDRQRSVIGYALGTGR